MPAAVPVATHDPKTHRPYTVLGPDCAEATSGRPPSASSPQGAESAVAPPGPRNRHERRRAARLARRLEKAPEASEPGAADPAPVPGPHAAKPRKKEPRSFEEKYLEKWCAERGPLFKSPRVAASRALALGAVIALFQRSQDWALRQRVSRVLDEALRPVAPSNNAASGQEWARARAMLTDLAALLREGSPAQGLTTQVAAYLMKHRTDADEDFDELRHYAWAELLVAMAHCRDEALVLRAARTMLAWTRDDARKVGREQRRAPLRPEVVELLEELRDALEGLRACFPQTLGPPRSHYPDRSGGISQIPGCNGPPRADADSALRESSASLRSGRNDGGDNSRARSANAPPLLLSPGSPSPAGRGEAKPQKNHGNGKSSPTKSGRAANHAKGELAGA